MSRERSSNDYRFKSGRLYNKWSVVDFSKEELREGLFLLPTSPHSDVVLRRDDYRCKERVMNKLSYAARKSVLSAATSSGVKFRELLAAQNDRCQCDYSK